MLFVIFALIALFELLFLKSAVARGIAVVALGMCALFIVIRNFPLRKKLR